MIWRNFSSFPSVRLDGERTQLVSPQPKFDHILNTNATRSFVFYWQRHKKGVLRHITILETCSFRIKQNLLQFVGSLPAGISLDYTMAERRLLGTIETSDP